MNLHHAYLQTMLRIADSDFDIVHNNSLHYLPPVMAHAISCPMVTALHTPPFPSLQSAVRLSSNHHRGYYTAVSAHLSRTWKPYTDHSYVIHNGIRTGDWSFSPQAETGTAFWLGRFCPEKGPHLAIQAAKRAGYRLRLAGAIYDRDYYRREIAPLLGDGVEYIGHLSHTQLATEIGRAQCGLFSSVWDEPFGLVLPEMLACDTPVVAFDSGAAAEVISPECGIIVPKGDVAAMATAMQQTRFIDREQCRLRAAADFPIERMIADYERLYERLIAATPVRSVGRDRAQVA